MRYIKNAELREWVKDNLRKAIFQKAHALAIQTGCEVLVKLQDVSDTHDSQCYATDTLQKAYYNKQLTRSPGEVSVSGETGLPITTRIDRASQSTSSSNGPAQNTPVVDLAGGMVDGIGSSTNQTDMDQDEGDDEEGTLKDYVHDDGIEDKQEQFQDASYKPEPKNGSLEEAELVGDKVIKDEMSTMACSVDESNNARLLKPANSKSTTEIMSSIQVKTEPQNSVDKEDTQQLSIPNTITINAESSVINVPVRATAETVPETRLPTTVPERVMSPSIRPYQCGVCQKTFGSIQVLSRHAQTFHGMNREMRYYCNICGQSYKLAQYLQAHVKMHDTVSVMPVLCKVCGMGYYSQAALQQHELTHSSPPILPMLEPTHIVSSAVVRTVASPPHTITSPSQETESSPPHTVTSLPHTVSSLPMTVTSPPEHAETNPLTQVQSKPNPRLQLAKTTPISAQKPPVTSGVSNSNRNSNHSPPGDAGHSSHEMDTGYSPPEAKRFKSTSSADETRDESYHEPKQYHCLVCGMAFEEGEQLEEHVTNKHMQGDTNQAEEATPSVSRPTDDTPDETKPSDEPIKLEDSEDEGDDDSLLQSSDYPSMSDTSSFSAAHMMSLPPFSTADNLAMYQQQQLFQSSLLNPNPNITSVLEQALPGLLPGISLLSNPTQLPMAHMASSAGAIADGYQSMVSQDGRFTCDICGNSYKYNCTLKEHRLTHAQTPLFSCKICNQAFSRQRQLRDHMFRHSGAYPYHCKLCGKGFVRPSILRRHETDRHKQAWENI